MSARKRSASVTGEPAGGGAKHAPMERQEVEGARHGLGVEADQRAAVGHVRHATVAEDPVLEKEGVGGGFFRPHVDTGGREPMLDVGCDAVRPPPALLPI